MTLHNAENEVTALMEFYQSLNGCYWKHDSNWFSDFPLDDWHGVSVDIGNPYNESASDHGHQHHVVKLALPFNKLHGIVRHFIKLIPYSQIEY